MCVDAMKSTPKKVLLIECDEMSIQGLKFVYIKMRNKSREFINKKKLIKDTVNSCNIKGKINSINTCNFISECRR